MWPSTPPRSVTFSRYRRYDFDVKEFKSFYNEHKKKFFSYLMRMTGDYDLSSDIMQESFTRYLEKYGGQQPSVRLLYTIGRNRVCDYARRQKRHPQIEWTEEGYVPDQERPVMIREAYREVLFAMEKLAQDEREVLALAVSKDLTYKEIARITGMSEANVKVKVHRARVKLRRVLRGGES